MSARVSASDIISAGMARLRMGVKASEGFLVGEWGWLAEREVVEVV